MEVTLKDFEGNSKGIKVVVQVELQLSQEEIDDAHDKDMDIQEYIHSALEVGLGR